MHTPRDPSLRASDRLRLLVSVASLVLPTSMLASCAGDEVAVDELQDVVMRTAPVSECHDFAASNDAMISNPPKAQNYGNHPLLRVGGNDESLLSFDLSSIPEGSTVDSATLRLYVNGGAGDGPVNIHAATAAWSEGTVTYQSFNQQFAGAISGAILPQSASALKSADVSGLVTSWLTGAQQNLGILLEDAGSKKTIFVSSEGAAGYAPSLEVCYTVPPTDYCEEDPCQNSGICVNGDDDYTCECAPGYTGTDCEIEIDECEASPCANGDCIDGVGGYTCECLPGWEGTNCEIDTNECAPNPCDNGGICTDGPNSYSCQCDAGYSGTDCETDIDDCAGDPCQNGGACSDGVADYSCACLAGFTGSNCEIDIDECVGGLCENESACVDGVNGYTCACLPGFAGVYCGENIDECAGDPCLNGGVCADGVAGYTCECAAGYGGDNCEIDIDDCAASPCLYGTCTDRIDAYSCACEEGYEGTNCDEETATACIEQALEGTLPLTVMGDLTGQGDEYAPTCGNGGGNDVAYQFVAPAAGYYRFDTIGTEGFDTMLAVFDQCAGVEVACHDDIVRFVDQDSVVEMALEAGQSVVIVVDSFDGVGVAFVLNIDYGFDDCAADPCPEETICANVGTSYTCTSSCPCLDESQGDGIYALATNQVIDAPTSCTTDPATISGFSEIVGGPDTFLVGDDGAGGAYCTTEVLTTFGFPPLPITNEQALDCSNLIAGLAVVAGLTCEGAVDPCEPNPCVHGTCESAGESYTCVCDEGYEGTNCETPVVVEAACPCSDMPFWIYALEQTPTSCSDDFGFTQVNIYYAGGPYNMAGLYSGGTVCGWEHFPHVAEGAMTISAEQAAACVELLHDWTAANSVECFSY
jgi:hypothetical protein